MNEKERKGKKLNYLKEGNFGKMIQREKQRKSCYGTPTLFSVIFVIIK